MISIKSVSVDFCPRPDSCREMLALTTTTMQIQTFQKLLRSECTFPFSFENDFPSLAESIHVEMDLIYVATSYCLFLLCVVFLAVTPTLFQTILFDIFNSLVFECFVIFTLCYMNLRSHVQLDFQNTSEAVRCSALLFIPNRRNF